MDVNHTICGKCASPCDIDGDYPKFFAWCYNCDDYAKGFDLDTYLADYLGSLIDSVKGMRKEG